MTLQFLESAVDPSELTFCCDICQTNQSVPDEDRWRCQFCGQEYSGGNGSAPTIALSVSQLAALRNHCGRDATGRSSIVPNWWTQNQKQLSGEEFLFWNRDMPARQHTRKLICDWAASGEITSILEVAFGGLHEYRALRDKMRELRVTYSGVDWTDHFVQHAQTEFPESRWTQGDIVRGVQVEPADLVYSQHMLEHIPSLEPAFSNMLRLAKRKLINIFFIKPKPFDGYDVVNWKHHPVYHNTYGIGHIEKVCAAHGFKCTWIPFAPTVSPRGGEMVEDVVLLAERL